MIREKAKSTHESPYSRIANSNPALLSTKLVRLYWRSSHIVLGAKSRGPSAKSKSRVGTATNRPQSSKSNVSFQENDLKEKLMAHTHAFTGYNLGDSLLHVNGDQSYLFPNDKGLIKIEKTRFIQGNLYVQVSVMTRGHTFSVNLANPVDEDALDEVVEQVKEANSNGCDMVKNIPSIETTDFGKKCVQSGRSKFRKIVKMRVFWSLFRMSARCN